MEYIKRNWYWLIPAACLVGYFVWKYVQAKIEVQKQMQKVRQAKAEKSILREFENEPLNDSNNVSNN